MQFITLVKTLISLLPTLVAAVQALETALPESGQGVKKLEALKGLLSAAYGAATDTTAAFETIWPALSGAAGAIVALLKR